MQFTNKEWLDILQAAHLDINSLMQPETIKQLDFIIKINEKVAESVGHMYLVYLRNIFNDLLRIYGLYS